MEKLKLLEWSLNLSSLKNRVVHEDVEKNINNEVVPDIIFLMETVRDNDFVIKNYVKVVESDNWNGNTVSIYIKEILIKEKEVIVEARLGRIPNEPLCISPNFAQVNIRVNGIRYHLMAYRTRVSNSSYYDFLERRKQMDTFLRYIARVKLENIIIMGDFNNGNIRGDINDSSFATIMHNEKYDQIKARYFYQRIREDFREEGLVLKTPRSGYSYGIYDKKNNKWNKNANADYGYLKIDHIVVSEGIEFFINEKEETLISYDWNFLETYFEKGKEKLLIENSEIKKGFPDHAMLIAEVMVKK